MITQTEILRYLNITISVWATTTAYKAGNYVSKDGVIYECLVDHTSGTFATDVTNLKWSADTLVLGCANRAISDVNSFCNRDFRGAAYTWEFTGEGLSSVYVPNAPLNSVTSIKYFDEDTSGYVTIFEGADTVSNSVKILPGGILKLYNGYSFQSGTLYQVVYNGGYASNALWVTGTAYEVGNYVVNNSNRYVCLTAHTAGTFATDLTAAKWELSTVEYVPYDITNVTLEKATWLYKSSPNGGGRLGLSSENTGGQSSDGKSFDVEGMNTRHEKLMQRYRIQNV